MQKKWEVRITSLPCCLNLSCNSFLENDPLNALCFKELYLEFGFKKKTCAKNCISFFSTVVWKRAGISSQTLNVNLSCPKYVLVYFKEFLVLKVKSLASSCGNLMENKRSHERALAVWLLSILQKLRRQHDLCLLFLILLICLKDHTEL